MTMTAENARALLAEWYEWTGQPRARAYEGTDEQAIERVRVMRSVLDTRTGR